MDVLISKLKGNQAVSKVSSVRQVIPLQPNSLRIRRQYAPNPSKMTNNQCFFLPHSCSSFSKNNFLYTKGALSSWNSTFLCSQNTLTVILSRFPLPNCPQCSTFPLSTFSPSSYFVLGLNLYLRNFRLAFSFFSISILIRISLSVWLRDFSFWSMMVGSVISCMESWLPPLEVPLRLMIGTSVGANWLILPEGMELPQRFWPDCTGGSSFIGQNYQQVRIQMVGQTSTIISSLLCPRFCLSITAICRVR